MNQILPRAHYFVFEYAPRRWRYGDPHLGPRETRLRCLACGSVIPRVEDPERLPVVAFYGCPDEQRTRDEARRLKSEGHTLDCGIGQICEDRSCECEQKEGNR